MQRCPLPLLAAALALLAGVNASAQEVNLAGDQVWNCEYWQTVEIGDFYGPNLNLKKNPPTIVLEGARNGWYSGFVVATSALGILTDLRGTIGPLTGPGGATIPADRIQIRYPERGEYGRNWLPAQRFDGLVTNPPAEVAIVHLRENRGWKPKTEGPISMQPVWVTVNVPADAVPGDYSATLTIETQNLQPFAVPVKLKVHGWTLPDPRGFTVQNLAFLSPERLAEHYEVPRWSERHYELMGQSLAWMLQLGSRQLILNLVCDYPAQLNEESMVRWIRKADGSYDHDFTIVDRYLDICAKTIGKPFPIRLNMWNAINDKNIAASWKPVTLLDPATGKLEKLPQPECGTEESYLFWKPVLDGIRARAEKRGWFDAVTVNWMEYCGGPPSNAVAVLHRIWPDGKWSSWDHGRRHGYVGPTPAQNMPCVVNSTVWNEGAHKLRGYKNAFKPGTAYGGHSRGFHRDNSPLLTARIVCEQLIMKGCSGADPLGGDLFPVADRRRNWDHMWVAYALGPGNCSRSYLAPGPDGPIATERFEAFREGVQLCEALIYLQRTLEGGKLAAELAAKVERVLDARGQALIDAFAVKDKSGRREYAPDIWGKVARERDAEIFALAAEVAAAAKSAT